ncbi:MAG: chemotaxis protein MotA [Methylococcaceae bacterium]|nr:chemotaxis protein MotA [Methylococcaceae bacterium]
MVVGTLAATMLGQSPRGVLELLKQLPEKLKTRSEINEVDMALFVKVADFFRLGNIRYAELGARRITTPLLRSGAQMVLDRTPSADIQRTLQWKIGAQRERDNAEIQIFRTMMTLAPAFGMLGTLFGLISMLYGLDARTMEHIGEAMGFAMLTTVYGLLAANLLLKPVILRLENNSRKRLAWMVVQAEAVAMMEEKCHAQVIQDSLLAFMDSPEVGINRSEIELSAVHSS